MSANPPAIPTEPTPTEPDVQKEPTITKAPPTGRKFPCAQCGAKLNFDPSVRNLKCPYCGHVEVIPEPTEKEVREIDYSSYLETQEKRAIVKVGDKASQIRCTGCGAVLVFEDKIVTQSCPYCLTHLESKPEALEDMILPESIVPFGITDRIAKSRFTAWVEGLWFAPTELKKLANLGQLVGIYIPYWTYDAMTYSPYHGMRGDNYWVTEYFTDADGSRKSRSVMRTRWYNVSGEVQHFFDDVLICGSHSLLPKLMLNLEPWELDKLNPFKAEYLSGFNTERYAVNLKEGFESAQKIMEDHIYHLICRDIGGDQQRVHDRHTNYVGVTFKHILLPVWVASYRYHEKVYHLLINGQTGKVVGDRPWSWMKIIRLILLIAAVIGIIAYFVK